MNRCQANLTTKQVLATFLDRFKVVPQHCPCALRLGWTHLAEFVAYYPSCPFDLTARRYPFKDEEEAKRFCQIKLETAVDHLLKFQESDRQWLLESMLRDDGNECEVKLSYDALAIKYLHVLLPALRKHMNPEPEPKPEPLLPKDAFGAKPTVNVTRWAAKLEQSINQSLKLVEFFFTS